MRTDKTIASEIKQWCQYHDCRDENWFVKTLRDAHFSDLQILIVIETLDQACHECYGKGPCSCWNDE